LDLVARIQSHLVGHQLIAVERSEYDWHFRFQNELGLRAYCPWRILVEGKIAHGNEDHAQHFGLAEPIDGAERSYNLLFNKVITGVAIRDDTSDLTVHFSHQTTLEVLNNSSGYDGWQIWLGIGVRFVVVATGGGGIAMWES